MRNYLFLQRGPSSSEAELKSPAAKKAKVATGKRQKAPPKDDLDTSSSADEKEASTDHKPAIHRAVKRRKVDYIEDDDDDQGSPVRRAGALSTKRGKAAGVKESESSKKQEPVVLLPKAAYPPELGYSDGKKVVSEMHVKESESSKKQEPVVLLPKAAYPPELGYSDGKKVVSEMHVKESESSKKQEPVVLLPNSNEEKVVSEMHYLCIIIFLQPCKLDKSLEVVIHNTHSLLYTT